MPNPGNPSGGQTPNSGRQPGQSQDSDREWQSTRNQEQDDDATGTRAENVEVGDSVPEKNRTMRASRDRQGLSNGQGETGEDEGLSGDAGDNERH